MPFKDLRQFIDTVDEIHELARIENADWNLEIGAISEVAIDSQKCPAVLFDNVKGYPKGFRIFANPVRKYTRVALALDLPHTLKPIDILKSWRERSRSWKPIKYHNVNSGPSEENVDEGEDVDLFKFPAPLWHKKDGGRYIGTADLVINKDFDSDWINAAIYRVQVFDKNTVGLYIEPGHHGRTIAEKYWERGKSCPVAITCGQDPALWIAGALPLPYNVSELDQAGALRGESLEVFQGKYSGLPIPTSAEIVIEGDYLPPQTETRIEGPFGEWTGYYGSGARPCPVVKVRRVMYRTNPIIMGAPPARGNSIGVPFYSVGIWNALEASGVPNVMGVWSHIGTGLLVVVSIKQSYAGHAMQAGVAALGSRGGMFHGTFVVVVDEDIDPSNLEEVIWAVTTRCDPAESLEIIRNCWTGNLDTRISPEKREKGEFANGRAIINACRPFEWMKAYPEVSALDNETKSATLQKWKGALGL